MTGWFSDLRSALRMFTRAPGYVAVASVVLALGIGTCSAVYAVLDTVVLKPWPYPESGRLVRIYESRLPQFARFSVAPGNFETWHDQAQAFQALALYRATTVNLTGRPTPLRLKGLQATPELFQTLGVGAELGQSFDPARSADPSYEPVVLSDSAWRVHFGAEPSALGSAITLNDHSYTVVGVMPARFDFPQPDTDFYSMWRIGAKEAQDHGAHYGSAIGRLKPNATLAQAAAELDTIAARIEREHPETSGWRTLPVGLSDDMLGEARDRIGLLFAGVWLVLLIACANVAGLTVARVSGRAHELAIRRAQGASGARIVRQLGAEGALLAVLGWGGGLAAAATLLPLLKRIAPEGIPRLAEVEIGSGVILFAAGVAALAAISATVVPAALAARRAVADDLREGARSAGAPRRSRMRSALVVAEVALAILLLAGAGLLGRSLLKLAGVDPGFRPDETVLTVVALPSGRYKDYADAARFFSDFGESAARLPGVQAAGVTNAFPMANDMVNWFEVEGQSPPAADELVAANDYSITPGYLAAMSIPVLSGRGFESGDRADAAPVALVSASFVRKFLPGLDPIGRRIRIGNAKTPWREIVGLVGDVRQYGLDAPAPPQMYVPFEQAPYRIASIVLRTAQEPQALQRPLRALVQTLDPDQPLGRIWSARDLIGTTLVARRFATVLLLGFACAALLLAALGLYATISYTVVQGTREIGVRMALGARARDVLWNVLVRGGSLALAGVLLGILAVLSGGQLLEAFVFELSPRDPATLAGVGSLMLAVALLACALPAWRAARIDPMVALRHE